MMQILFFAAVLLLANVTPASAAFLVPIVASALAISTVAASVIVSVASIAVSFGISYVVSLMKGKPEQTKQPGGVELDLRVDADVPQTLIVGRAVTAGSLNFVETYGKRSEDDNSDLVEIIAIADHPVTGLVKTFVDTQEVTLVPNDPEIEILLRRFGRFAENRGMIVAGEAYAATLALQFYDGTQTAADPLAVGAFGSHPERPWTSAMIGRGRSYVRTHCIYDKERMTGPVGWRFVVDGIKLYDPRKDSTVGGSGAHRFNNLATHEFSRNLPLICYNILRGIRVLDHEGTPRHFYGLETTTAASTPFANWVAAMNEADTLIDGEPQFWGGAEISLDTEPLETVRNILQAMGGRLSELGGVFKLHIGAPALPSLTFDDESLRANEGDNFRPITPFEQRVNYVTGKFTSPDDGWIPKPAPARSDEDRIALDGQRIPANLDVPFVQSSSHMQRLQKQLLARALRERNHTVPLPPGAFGLEAGDSVEWTSERNGYTDKLFEVDAVELSSNFDTVVSLVEIDHDDYEWDAETDLVEQPIESLVTTLPAAKVIEGFDAEGVTHSGANGITRAAIRVVWTAPEDGDAARVEVQVRRSVSLTDPVTHHTDDVAAGVMLILSAVTPATAYQVRGRFISFNGYESSWSDWENITTPDVRIVQAELSAALDARVRQVAEQFPALIADIREEIGIVTSSLADHVSGIREDLGRLRIGVGARYGENSAAVQQALVAMADGDSALAALITSLTAVVDGNTAAISSEAVTRASADTALAGSITTLTSTVGANTAAIVSEAATRASGDSSLAGRIESFLATSGSGTAEGKIRFIASSAPSGVVASFAIEVNVSASGPASWQPSGIYLDAMVGFSRIRLVANQIEMVHPSLNSGASFPMFSIASHDGQNVAVFNALVYMQKLVADAIQTKHIAANNIVVPSFASASSSITIPQSASPPTFTCLTASITFTGVAGRNVLLTIDGGFENVGSGGTAIILWWVEINGVTVDTQLNWTNGAAVRVSFNGGLTITASGSSQTITAELKARYQSGLGGTQITSRRMKLQAFVA